MVSRILLCLLILLALPLYSQSSPKPASDYTHCFTDIEWAAFEEEVWAEEQRAIKEAIDVAVQPYMAIIRQQDRQLLWWKIGCGAAGAAALASFIWAAVK